MIYVATTLYFLCGLGVATASDEDKWVAFLVTILLWPMIFMFALCVALGKIAGREQPKK